MISSLCSGQLSHQLRRRQRCLVFAADISAMIRRKHLHVHRTSLLVPTSPTSHRCRHLAVHPLPSG
jgi:hypothetical protein